ncbi:hypothetical protein AX16_007635 [Volvariella volvacea WC 439]|nr:hypothetical protein AX16_007635 [Volvariella volvacea WC 439]
MPPPIPPAFQSHFQQARQQSQQQLHQQASPVQTSPPTRFLPPTAQQRQTPVPVPGASPAQYQVVQQGHIQNQPQTQVPAPSQQPPPPHAPDSPRQSQSPPPTGVQGDLEMELWGLANSLYNLGTTVISDLTKERDNLPAGKQVGQKVNEVVGHLATIDRIAQETTIKIPVQVLADIDNAKNPMQLTRDRLERAATENQFMNAKIAAIASYREYLNEALCQNFPELELYLKTGSSESTSMTT